MIILADSSVTMGKHSAPDLDPSFDRPTMYVLLDLPTDVGADRLRYVYEQHVADAARCQDHRRLLRLSQAFDALPRSMRLAMYPKFATGVSAPGRRSDVDPWPYQPGAKVTPHVAPGRPIGAAPPRRGASRFSLRSFTGLLTVAVALVGVFFAHATHLLGGPASAGLAAAPASQTVDVQAIAADIESREHLPDIVCNAAGPASRSALTCRAGNGEVWAVWVYRPPNGYTATLTRRSTAEQSAYADAVATVRDVRQCKEHGGTLPASVHSVSGRIRMACGGGVLTQPLRTGNRVQYTRVSPTWYRVVVTADDGEHVDYDSRTGKFVPPQ